ncbi:MAG: PH domain-containing protein [Patescibacteria group bacterium]|nr:PH domain-containing protein [Patescibacteria group bacterium]
MTAEKIIHPKSYEKTFKIVRRDLITFVPPLALFILLAAAPVGVNFLLQRIFPTLMQSPTVFIILILFGSVYCLSVLLFLYSYFISFYLDMWVITNDRLVDIEQISLFGRSVSEVDLYQIQDITSEVKGFFPSIFDYGTITLQTAGAVPKFILKNVPDPNGLRKFILDMASEDKNFHGR